MGYVYSGPPQAPQAAPKKGQAAVPLTTDQIWALEFAALSLPTGMGDMGDNCYITESGARVCSADSTISPQSYEHRRPPENYSGASSGYPWAQQGQYGQQNEPTGQQPVPWQPPSGGNYLRTGQQGQQWRGQRRGRRHGRQHPIAQAMQRGQFRQQAGQAIQNRIYGGRMLAGCEGLGAVRAIGPVMRANPILHSLPVRTPVVHTPIGRQPVTINRTGQFNRLPGARPPQNVRLTDNRSRLQPFGMQEKPYGPGANVYSVNQGRGRDQWQGRGRETGWQGRRGMDWRGRRLPSGYVTNEASDYDTDTTETATSATTAASTTAAADTTSTMADTSSMGGGMSSIPSWVWLAGGGVLVLMFMMKK